MSSFLLGHWQKKGWIAFAFQPLSLLFFLLVGLRKYAYQLRLVKSEKVDATVVVIGNVIAGGAGKTPTTQAIVRHLHSKGYKVGVISRGYGRSTQDVREVTSASTPSETGDEPLLIFESCRVPVFVGAKRVEAAQALLKKYPDTAILVCDDGLQHYALHRDVEVCVFDDRGIGNGQMLPSGPLRESWPRRLVGSAGQSEHTSLYLLTGNPTSAGAFLDASSSTRQFRATRRLANEAVTSNGQKISINPGGLNEVKPLAALAGIARPEAFFEMLKAQGLKLDKCIPLPDHYDFADFKNQIDGTHQILCTEKDARKLWPLDPSALAVPLILEPEDEFFDTLVSQLPLPTGNQSHTNDGHKTS